MNYIQEMTVMTNNITEMEDNFARWQATLIKQGDEERKLIANDSAKKQAKLTEKVQALEESLQVAADEITRLSITVAELNDTTAYVTTIASQSENLMANTDKEYIAKACVCHVSELEQDNKDLTEQIIDITRRRMKLQTQYDKMEEESEKLKLHIKKATETITSLMTENGTLKERQRRFSKAEIIMEEITLD
ncbi:hypothetical protein BC936DRAFT_139264 [Jimgerdemannia flammicorona]|uniref:Uncharacterized protein n=1 Tax=Jimgerdemannia flammicorona TaxID=994334 RepID=A0A433BA88_9FUNG|nr:hypothetical protein BC936DRAFT_139264 [Jimgerdemannia flammicorona]